MTKTTKATKSRKPVVVFACPKCGRVPTSEAFGNKPCRVASACKSRRQAAKATMRAAA